MTMETVRTIIRTWLLTPVSTDVHDENSLLVDNKNCHVMMMVLMMMTVMVMVLMMMITLTLRISILAMQRSASRESKWEARESITLLSATPT